MSNFFQDSRLKQLLINQNLTIFADEAQALDSRFSSPSGMFEVNANTNGRALNETDLTPVIRFYHRCDVDANKVDFSKIIFSKQHHIA